MKWYSETYYVDIDTGELLTKSQVLREGWRKVNTTYKVEDKKQYLLKIVTNEYKRNEQLSFSFD